LQLQQEEREVKKERGKEAQVRGETRKKKESKHARRRRRRRRCGSQE
jgi:hypothetical protein